MKRIFFTLLFLGIITTIFSQKMGVMLDYKSFCTDKLEPYIEFNFLIDGQSVQYAVNENGKYQAEIEVLVEAKQNDTLVGKLHFIIVSEEFADSVKIGKPDFLTLDYLPLPNGEYFLDFTLKDLHSSQRAIIYKDIIQLYFPRDKISNSSISLLSELQEASEENVYNKYGFTLTPLYFSYAPEEQKVLPYMIEVYNTEKVMGKNNSFIVKSYLEWFDSGLPVSNQPIYFENRETAPVVIVLHQFNIYKLYSGNYNLVIEILDRDSNILSTNKAFFQRNNPINITEMLFYETLINENNFVSTITNVDEIEQYISMLFPIANSVEQLFIKNSVREGTLVQKQNFFYNFWIKRNSQNPEEEWQKYKEKVDYVQKVYGSKVIKGYQTDRGRVYLKYGKPTQIHEVPYDPQAYPYEIWTYYVLNNQTNVKFVFYDRDLATNEYELLHSDAIGEVRNPRWQMELTKRLHPNLNPDIKVPDDYWGGEINDNWRLNR